MRNGSNRSQRRLEQRLSARDEPPLLARTAAAIGSASSADLARVLLEVEQSLSEAQATCQDPQAANPPPAPPTRPPQRA